MAKIVGKTLGWVGYTTGLGTNNWHTDNDANLRKIDALLQAGAIAIQNGPPGSPTEGQVYVVGTAPTGAWASNANAIARWNGVASAWEFFAPSAGWWVSVGAQEYRYSGSAWVAGWTPAHAATHEYGGADPLTGANIAGLRVSDSPEWAGASLNGNLWLKTGGNRAWSMGATATSLEIAARNSDGSAIDWPIIVTQAAGGTVAIGGETSRPVNIKYSLQVNAVDTITSTREGRFTGLRLTNLSSGQIPVSSDGNGQITASGLTDDGTFLGINRTIRAWNSLSRSGNTWTDLQWTQDAQERVTMLSSNGSGSGAYHTLAMVHADAEATGRVLGFQVWGQKVSGKSGSNPGVKVDVSVYSVGTGGTIGGFGGQYIIRYRPNNGAGMSTAFRVGAFDGGVVDAVQADILFRALSGAKLYGDPQTMVWVGNPFLYGNLTLLYWNAISNETIPSGPDQFVYRCATPNLTHTLPPATGSGRVFLFRYSGSSGGWTIQRQGSDVIDLYGANGATVTSFQILASWTSSKAFWLMDAGVGRWEQIN